MDRGGMVKKRPWFQSGRPGKFGSIFLTGMVSENGTDAAKRCPVLPVPGRAPRPGPGGAARARRRVAPTVAHAPAGCRPPQGLRMLRCRMGRGDSAAGQKGRCGATEQVPIRPPACQTSPRTVYRQFS
jgi:hypothetical protein